jgi:hypothetical protein
MKALAGGREGQRLSDGMNKMNKMSRGVDRDTRSSLAKGFMTPAAANDLHHVHLVHPVKMRLRASRELACGCLRI